MSQIKLIVYSAVIVFSCGSEKVKEGQSTIDSTQITEIVDNEVTNDYPDPELSGSSLGRVNSNLFLSGMLYHLNYFRNYSDSSGTVRIKAINNRYSPIESQEYFTPEYATIDAGNYSEGFGGLRLAYMNTISSDKQSFSEFNNFKNSFEELSQTALIKPKTEVMAFNYYEPAAIHWCMKNFYRGPGENVIEEISNTALYDIVFKKFVRTLITSHYHVAKFDFENEKHWYKNAVIIESKHAPGLLMERYKIPESINKEDINPYYYPLAAGFWIRRSIDETESTLWPYLLHIATEYDYHWLCSKYQVCERG